MKREWQIGQLIRATTRVGLDWFLVFGPLLIVLPCWLYLSSQAYSHWRDFVIDACVTWFWIVITSILLIGAVKFRAEMQLRGYVFITLAVVMALLMCWNLVSLYSDMGAVPITWFGYQMTARPFFYWLIFVLVFVLIWLGVKWFGKQNNIQETSFGVTSEWGETRQKGKWSFILRYGVFQFGTLYGVFLCLSLIRQERISFWDFALPMLAGWACGGLLGWGKWHYSEKEYLEAAARSVDPKPPASSPIDPE
jgi:hypothetical protein